MSNKSQVLGLKMTIQEIERQKVAAGAEITHHQQKIRECQDRLAQYDDQLDRLPREIARLEREDEERIERARNI